MDFPSIGVNWLRACPKDWGHRRDFQLGKYRSIEHDNLPGLGNFYLKFLWLCGISFCSADFVHFILNDVTTVVKRWKIYSLGKQICRLKGVEFNGVKFV